MRFFSLGLAALPLQASLLQERQSGPSVTILNGTVVGTTADSVDSFKGIPYAQPPVGNRRLRPPAVLASSFGTLRATSDGPECPPNTATSSTALGPEDCLYLNVQRPAGVTAGRNLPVVVYLYGGGFQLGSTKGIDAAQLIAGATTLLGEPFIFVNFNYRLTGYGFLAGAELSIEGSTNLGLRDQRLALQWIQDNIRAFGGDPTRVTIWGESAGAWSALDQMVINGGISLYKKGQLFRAAILASGTSLPAFPVRHPRPQAIFDKVVATAGCSNSADKLQCLRGVSASTFAYAVAAAGERGDRSFVPYMPRPDPASTFFPRSPEKAIAAGTFMKIPLIIGNQEDEGTDFVGRFDSYSSSTSGLVTLLRQQVPELSLTDATAFVETYPGTYPNSVTAGSPFRTGLENEVFTGYKRVAALYGDYLFALQRRISLDSMAPRLPAYSSVATYLYGQSNRGTRHGIDTRAILYANARTPVFYQKKLRYISFWTYTDPNYLGVTGNSVLGPAPNFVQWPRYTTTDRQTLNFENTNTGVSLFADTFRQNSYLEMKRNLSRFST